MIVTSRDIEKLEAIGYHVDDEPLGDGDRVAIADRGYQGMPATIFANGEDNVAEAWAACKAHSQSPEGMVATMADKVRFIEGIKDRAGFPSGVFVYPYQNGHRAEHVPSPHSTMSGSGYMGEGESPEVAVHALWEKVP